MKGVLLKDLYIAKSNILVTVVSPNPRTTRLTTVTRILLLAI